jgi:hypothetical protein
MRVPVNEMVHARSESKPDMVFTGTGGLTVGDWVEVMHDFSPGHNSGGGVGVIVEIIESLSNVRYIVDGHVEKFIPLTRLTTIPMPYRREKAQLRLRSTQSKVPNPKSGKITSCFNALTLTLTLILTLSVLKICIGTSVAERTSFWGSMNDIELLQHGLDEGYHKTEGWLWRRLVLNGVVEDSKDAKRVRVFQAHQSQKIFIMAQKQVMPVGWDPIDPIRSVKVNLNPDPDPNRNPYPNPNPTPHPNTYPDPNIR